MKLVRYIFSVLFVTSVIHAHTPSIIFKENKGQWPKNVLFGTEVSNSQFYVTKNGFNYCIYSPSDLKKGHELHHNKSEQNAPLRGHNYKVDFIGSNLNEVTKKIEQTAYYNYFLGNDRSKWANNVKAYGDLLFENVYHKINLRVYSSNVNLKYDFIIAPGGNCSLIKLDYGHVDGLEIINNELIIKTSVGNIVEKEPYAYQTINGIQTRVKCKYALLNEHTIGFSFPEGYDDTHELIIDPTVVVCSYSGFLGTGANSACGYDQFGNIFVAGYCGGGYPTTMGAFTSTYYGMYDMVLSKYNSTGSSKIFATYIGGDSLEIPFEVIVKNNEITIAGISESKNFPRSINSFDTIKNGTVDIVLAKLNLSGSTLLGSTYVGGSKNEGWSISTPNVGNYDAMRNMEMLIDTTGNVYVISATNSANFPVTSGAVSATLKGFTDACVFKMNNTLSTLIWSTYIGGSKDESGKAIRFDGTGGLYLFGTTTSTNFPVSANAISSTKNGGISIPDMYVSHLNSSATGFISSTYLGTTAYDYAGFMDVDQNGDVYICGNISSPSSLVPTAGVYSNSNGTNTIYKLNGNLSSVIFKTKFGLSIPPVFPAPDPYLGYSAFRVDSCQNIYLAGAAENYFPTTSNQLQAFGGGRTDIYIAHFNANCTSLKFASFWGGADMAYNFGEHSDGGVNHFDSKGCLYQAICSNGGLPTTANAYSQTFIAGGDTIWNDAFVKIDLQTFVNANSSYGATITGCPPFTTNFISTTNLGTTYWDFGNGNTSTNPNETQTYLNLGTYNVLLVVTDTSTCNKTDSIKSVLNVINPTEFDLGGDIEKCISDKLLLKSNISAVSYTWSTGQTTPNIYVTQPGMYMLTINNGGCNTSDQINVKVGEKKFSERFPNVITPNNDNANDCIQFSNYRSDEIEFIVYDRWGKERYKTNNPNENWCPDNLIDGTYFYVVTYKSECTGESHSDRGFINVYK